MIGSESGHAGVGAAIGGGAGALVGGALGNAEDTASYNDKKADEMLLRQQKEIDRQKRELEDVKRQKYYDDQYRKYEEQRK